jgi:hypothetical protein
MFSRALVICVLLERINLMNKQEHVLTALLGFSVSLAPINAKNVELEHSLLVLLLKFALRAQRTQYLIQIERLAYALLGFTH